MKPLPEINIGLLGLGVVGGGVASALLEQGDALARKTGRRLRLAKVLVRDPSKPRSADVPAGLITTNPEEVLADPRVQVVVELMGGTDPAEGYLRDALTAGKHVVTANKEVMAKHGPELLALAQSRKVHLLFEASVGGGIPIVGCLTNQLLANDIRSVRSIINGTTNYILTRMAHEHTDFPQALREAQERGYAEADPTNDVEGYDAAYKLSVLAYLAFHQRVPPEQVHREGISRLQAQDFRYAQELGYAIKPLAIATLESGALQARVYPALVPLANMLAKVDGVYNAVEVEGSLCGRVLFHGRGAGREPTTSAVLGDLVEIARRWDGSGPARPVGALERPWPIRPMGELRSRYYLRLTVADRPGVLAQIARLLGESQISIAAVVQKDTNAAEQTAELVITTHTAREASVQQAMQAVSELGVVKVVNNLLRIEE